MDKSLALVEPRIFSFIFICIVTNRSEHYESILHMLKSINETADALRLGRTNVYSLIKSGKLSTVKIGRRTLVKTSSIDALINGSDTVQ